MNEQERASAVAVGPQPGELPTDGGFVLLGMPDLQGQIRGKALSRSAFEAAMRDGAALTDLMLAVDPVDNPITEYESFGLRAGASDLLLHPEPSTLHELSWRPGWHVCIGTPRWRDGRGCELASREVLRTVLASVTEVDYDVLAAFEYEVRFRDAEGRPLSSGLSYSATEIGRFEELMARLVPALQALGVELGAVHTEAGPGLLELNLTAQPALDAADSAALVKLATKEIASSIGFTASFLAKTRPGEEGSSGHIHFSCWSDGRNAFSPSAPDAEFPQPLTSAVGGVLDHLPAASLLLNPTVNSYKRLVPGWFAPVNVSWGFDNRSCALRAISSGLPERSRLECRRPGADANPYLALAGLLAAMVDGIRRDARPPAPVEGDASERSDLPPLPGSLESALTAFRADDVLRRALGESFSDYFATSREWELRAWRETVSDWERERYERAV